MENPDIIAKVKKSIRTSRPLTITSHKLPHKTEVQLEEILSVFLDELGKSDLKNYLSYCLKELAVNAKKANTKRIYFKEKQLNLDDPLDYQKGMATFRQETFDNIEYWLDLQKDAGLFVKFVFHPQGRNFKISVKNNSEITRKEQMRIYDRIARSRAFETLEEAFAEVLDGSEGAGLGIVILILMLRKMGLSEDAYEIDVEDGNTTASIIIPISKTKLEQSDVLMDRIVKEIERLPGFPENIVAIQKMIADPDSAITDIARKISTDPVLTADLLRTVNSAQYMLPNKMDNIGDAVKMLGLRGLNNMLIHHEVAKILSMPSYPTLWRHSSQVGFYSYVLSRQITRNRNVIDDTFVGGILHDIGKVIFSTIHPDFMEKISTFSTRKNISVSVFEDLAGGFSHAEIGAKLAEKWNFSDSLIEIIRYHHEPNQCSQKHRSAVYCVYLGNFMSHYEKNKDIFDSVDYNLLSKFHITSKAQLEELSKQLKKSYVEEMEDF